MDEAEEVFDVVFLLNDEPTEGEQPGEQLLNLPPSARTTQLADVLDPALAPTTVKRYQLNIVLCIDLVRVVRFVVDKLN